MVHCYAEVLGLCRTVPGSDTVKFISTSDISSYYVQYSPLSRTRVPFEAGGSNMNHRPNLPSPIVLLAYGIQRRSRLHVQYMCKYLIDGTNLYYLKVYYRPDCAHAISVIQLLGAKSSRCTMRLKKRSNLVPHKLGYVISFSSVPPSLLRARHSPPQ
jgi:hypothetical protein